MMDIVVAVADLDQATALHAARILIIIDAFATDPHTTSIEGLTKLAKLDFLLRYPVMLERALEAKGISTRTVKLESHERCSVESEMVRYRFGPWDHRYREFLNVLISKGLVLIANEGRKINITITDLGKQTATRLKNSEEFIQYTERAAILKRHFDITATNLMRFIYDTFPEILTLQSNEKISI